MIPLQGIAFKPINLLVAIFLCQNQIMMFMKSCQTSFGKIQTSCGAQFFYSTPPPFPNSPPKKRAWSILIVSKLTLVIIECLFHNYSTSHFMLMFYVLCRDIQHDHSRFVSFYVLRDFFPSPPLNKYLLEYVEDIV